LDAKAIFDRLDTNKDGKLSFDEFSAGLRQFQERMTHKRQDGVSCDAVKGTKPGPKERQTGPCGHECREAKAHRKGPPGTSATEKKSPEARKCHAEKSDAKPAAKPDAKKSETTPKDAATAPAQVSGVKAVLAAVNGEQIVTADALQQQIGESMKAMLSTLDNKCGEILTMLQEAKAEYLSQQIAGVETEKPRR
jgi:hypothetical protein